MRLHTVMLGFAFLLTALSALAADMDKLRPSAQWLATERLRGTLFHHTIIRPPDPLLIAPVKEDAQPAPAPIVLRGRHNLVILPAPGESIHLRLKTVQTRPPFRNTLYAIFNAEGAEIANGLVAENEEKEITIAAQGAGPHIVLLNSGPASSTATEVTVLNRHWAIDVREKQPYRDGPMHYHFLRDLKIGGFNLAMIDVETVPQEFLTDEGLKKWTAAIAGWADAAKRYQLRSIFAIDLGGSKAEVESWGDAPKGLYITHDEKLPLAPCPLQKDYWERIFLRRAREVAKLSLTNPYIVGFGIDPEMYQCWMYGHYMLSGTCFCDHCLGGFLKSNALPDAVLKEKLTGKERYEWIKQQKLYEKYDAYLEDEMFKIASWCRDDLHRINPDFLLNVYVLEIGNWFCRGMARGLGQPDLPVVNFCEHTYYSVGYDRDWLDKTIQKFKDIGAHMLQGSAIWDMHFPPTKPGYFAAHAYNLAVRAEGWWYWPGDRLYDDWNVAYSYQGQPAYVEDYWNAAATANHEIDLTMQQPGRTSSLDNAETVPWKGKYNSKKGWPVDSGVAPYKEPKCRLHLAAPGKLYFAIPRRAKNVEVICLARGQGNGAEVMLLDPSGAVAGRAQGELDSPETITANAAEGIWAVEVKEAPGLALTDLGLAISPAAMACPAKDCLLASPSKEPGLVGYWPLDEGQGEKAADTSQKVAYNGALRGGKWVKGVSGSALAFADRTDGVLIPVGDGLNNLDQFTLSAWVRLDALPDRGNGATLINKGPETAAQHFWWWIGYPPNYALTLELGNEKHYTSAATKALEWKLGQWYHVAAVLKCEGGKTTVTHYRDGEEIGSRTLDEPFHSGSYDLQLGTYGTMHWLHGALDEVKIWDRPLSPDEIRTEARKMH